MATHTASARVAGLPVLGWLLLSIANFAVLIVHDYTRHAGPLAGWFFALAPALALVAVGYVFGRKRWL